MIEQHGEGHNSFFTDSRYWDCDCIKNYIHNKKVFGKICSRCGAVEDEMPDSRVHEIHEQLGIKYPKKYLTPTE